MGNYLDLQLFASTSVKQEQSGSSSHTEGGSSSSTQGWSSTNSHSETVGHSEGGAHSESSGKSWASGKVEDQTQAQRDKYNTDYNQGQKVDDAYNRLQQTLDQKPQFESQYENKLNELYDSIMNREKFTYDFNTDAMYQMYKDKYTTAGKSAMQDTMAQNAALSGGYGSSYAQTAGQQTYQNYLQQLNDMLPTLRNQAYSEYQDEGNRMLQQYNLASDAYNREYGQYRDNVSDWQSDRAFNQSNYQDERNFDYNQFANERNYWNQEYWNEKNAEQSTYNVADENNWNDSTSVTDTKSNTVYAENTNSSYWSDTSTNSWSNSMSSSNSGSGSTKSGGKTTADDVKKMSGSKQYDSRGFLLNDGYSTNDKNNTYYNSGSTNVASTDAYDSRGFALNNSSANYNGDYYSDGMLAKNSDLRNYSQSDINSIVKDIESTKEGSKEREELIKAMMDSGFTNQDISYLLNKTYSNSIKY